MGDMEVAAKMQVFLYVHKIRKEMLAEQAFLSLPFPEGKPEETNDEEEEKERRMAMATWKRTSTTLFNSCSRNQHKHQIHILHGCEKNSESEILAVLKQPFQSSLTPETDKMTFLCHL